MSRLLLQICCIGLLNNDIFSPSRNNVEVKPSLRLLFIIFNFGFISFL
jgi:hypothetical protein